MIVAQLNDKIGFLSIAIEHKIGLWTFIVKLCFFKHYFKLVLPSHMNTELYGAQPG